MVTIFVGSARLSCMLMEPGHRVPALAGHESRIRHEVWGGRNQEL